MIEKGDFFVGKDRYLFNDFEDAMFAWDHQTKRIMMKFVGGNFDSEVQHDHRLFNDAILSGREITREEYEAGEVAPIANRPVSLQG